MLQVFPTTYSIYVEEHPNELPIMEIEYGLYRCLFSSGFGWLKKWPLTSLSISRFFFYD